MYKKNNKRENKHPIKRQHQQQEGLSQTNSETANPMSENNNQRNNTNPSTMLKMDYLTEKRISQAEMERRYTWLQKARMSILSTKDRCRIIHEVRFPDNFNGLYSARFSQNGEVIITCFGTGGIQIRSGETAQLKATLRGGMETSFPIMCCRFHPNRKNIFYTSGACEPKNEVNTIDINASGEYLVSGGKDAAVRIYDSETAKLIMTYQKTESDLLHDKVTRYHRMRIFAARFHHVYSDLIITGGWDDTVRIWDIRDGGGSIRTIKGPHICGDAIDFRGTYILTGSWVVRESLQIWDLMSAKLIETIKPRNRPTTLEGEFLYTVQYFDGDPYNEHILAGGSGTGAVEVINIKEQKVADSFKVNKPIVALDSNGTTIVYGGMESVIRLEVVQFEIRLPVFACLNNHAFRIVTLLERNVYYTKERKEKIRLPLTRARQESEAEENERMKRTSLENRAPSPSSRNLRRKCNSRFLKASTRRSLFAGDEQVYPIYGDVRNQSKLTTHCCTLCREFGGRRKSSTW
uniref:Anaphase-promoting complex subunit 4-like WD40 domain-containing protein n=1 Tax=Vespula pensylvanica TaxID=30213 RepID=A0A834KUP6_VESPE|nr:hypothetical protein H0235_013033 [Vespula pensylvanica]